MFSGVKLSIRLFVLFIVAGFTEDRPNRPRLLCGPRQSCDRHSTVESRSA